MFGIIGSKIDDAICWLLDPSGDKVFKLMIMLGILALEVVAVIWLIGENIG